MIRRITLLLLPVVLLLGASELVLWMIGAGEPAARLPLSRGFDPAASYLQPDGGGYRTQIFDGLLPEIVIPPKGNRLRVLMFGGSNTQDFPDEYLGELLGERFEVVNLGRAGYGSERVAILLDQAMVLQPDLLFVYDGGHNEFVEGGFVIELREQWGGWLGLAEALSKLRTLNVLVSALRPAPAAPVASPERWHGDPGSFAGLAPEQTRLFYEAFERNVRRVCATAHEHDVSLLMCTVVSNDFSPPWVSTLPAGVERAFEELHELARASIPARFQKELWSRLTVPDWGTLLRPKDRREREERAVTGPLPRLRPLLGELAGAAPLWPDPALWSPQVHDVLATYAAVVERELDEGERSSLEKAAALLDQALALCPDHPRALFERALCSYLLGQDGEAWQGFVAAADADRAPKRANATANGLVRTVGADEGVAVLDCEAAFRARCPSGLVGYELMMDHCHLHPEARRALMRDAAPALAAMIRP